MSQEKSDMPIIAIMPQINLDFGRLDAGFVHLLQPGTSNSCCGPSSFATTTPWMPCPWWNPWGMRGRAQAPHVSWKSVANSGHSGILKCIRDGWDGARLPDPSHGFQDSLMIIDDPSAGFSCHFLPTWPLSLPPATRRKPRWLRGFCCCIQMRTSAWFIDITVCIYIYICVCVCVCMKMGWLKNVLSNIV